MVGYLKKNLPEDKFNLLVNTKPQPKMVNLVELIEQAKKRIS